MDSGKMRCDHLLHLDLNLTITRVHIVKLLFTTLAQVEFFLRIEILIQMENLTLSTQEQAQIIKSRILQHIVIILHSRPLMEQIGTNQQQRTELEVIPNGSRLIIDDRMLHQLAIFHGIMIAIHHGSLRIHSHLKHTMQTILSYHDFGRTNA